jgi:hypothetical protein
MSTDDDLSPEEMDALMADLAKRSGSAKPKQKEVDDDSEDLEAFLARLEADDGNAPAAPTKTKRDPLAKAFGEIEDKGLQKSDDSRPEQASQPQRPSPAAQSVDRSPSGGLLVLLHTAKWLLISLPVISWIWLLGAHLSRWIVVGWLVAAIATSVALGLPAWIWKATSKGTYRYWMCGLSIVLVVAVVAPLQQSTAEVLSLYGHWPTTGVAQWTDWDKDHPVRTGNRWVSDQIARQIPHQSPLPGDAELGSQQLGVMTGDSLPNEPTPVDTVDASSSETTAREEAAATPDGPPKTEESQDKDDRKNQRYPTLSLAPSSSSSPQNPCQGKERCVVVHLAPWCSACKNSLSTIEALKKKAEESDSLGVMAVVSSAEVERLNEMAATIGEGSFLDPDGQILSSLKVRGVPFWLTLDKDNNILASFSGTTRPREAHFRKLGLE